MYNSKDLREVGYETLLANKDAEIERLKDVGATYYGICIERSSELLKQQIRIETLERLAYELGQRVILYRNKTWPGTDQGQVVYRDYPELKLIAAKINGDD